MKKTSPKRKRYRLRQEHQNRKKSVRNANAAKDRAKQYIAHRRKNRKYYETIDARTELRRTLYSRIHPKKESISVPITGEFGLEESGLTDDYLRAASTFIDFHGQNLELEFSKCTRVWPSAIILLCSLARWIKLTSPSGTIRTSVFSTDSESDPVNAYLAHCGLYKYVERKSKPFHAQFKSDNIVKIRREDTRANISKRRQEIKALLREYSALNDDEREEFASRVSIEVSNNISEHGVSRDGDLGWWIIGQMHEKHKFISLCFADNGIGIRNSLATGPQRDDLPFANDPAYDSDFIHLAFTRTVSGAVRAIRRKGSLIYKRFPSGALRGNGLKRVLQTCNKLQIPIRVLSHYGYVCAYPDGTFEKRNFNNRVFAGTMFQFTIPAK